MGLWRWDKVRAMSHLPRQLYLSLAFVLLGVAGCASTTTLQLTPSPQAPVCRSSAIAQILWVTRWRPDQKDVAARETAVATGIGTFFEATRCFQVPSIRRLETDSRQAIQDAVVAAAARNEFVVLIAVRELGPTVKIGASLALVEGATEVVLDISEFDPALSVPRTFTAAWRSGGPGLIKGVASLPQDMQAALAASLQPLAP